MTTTSYDLGCYKTDMEPGDKRSVILPYSEVCMHMGVAGKPAVVELLKSEQGYTSAQIYIDGQKYSSPVTTGEAGIFCDDKGQHYTYSVVLLCNMQVYTPPGGFIRYGDALYVGSPDGNRYWGPYNKETKAAIELADVEISVWKCRLCSGDERATSCECV